MADVFPAPVRVVSRGIGALWHLAERTLRIVRPDDGEASHITDTAALRDFDRLDEEQLKDIGVRRKPRRIRWLEPGRGIAPVPVVEFDYFRTRR